MLGWPEEKRKMKMDLCKILMRIEALKFGTFTLASGKISPYYIDLRIIPSFTGAFAEVSKFYIELAKNEVEEFDRIAAVPIAGIPFAVILAQALKKPFLAVRKEVKQHGRGRMVEGILYPGDKVLVVDDLITTGGSIMTAVEPIKAEGGTVKDAVVLMDREEGGIEAMKDAGINVHALIKVSEAAKILYEVEQITKEQLDAILKQIQKK
jgi:orotate phosphoribosyltransferase